MFQSVTYQNEDYVITTDPVKLNRDSLHRLLANSYWASERPREVTEATLHHSLCFSLYHRETMVGFARVITDTAIQAYLCDVIIDQEHRGKGLGKWLVESILSHPDTRYVRRWWLATRDAHGLYRQFGFEMMETPDRYMQKINPDAFNQLVEATSARNG